MRFLVIDTGLSLDIVRQLVSGGYEVGYFINWIKAHPELEDMSYGDGLWERWNVERLDNFYHVIDDYDIILFSDIGWGDDIDFLRESGYKVFGASKEGELLENDRMFAKDICREYGLMVPDTHELNVMEAIKFVKKEQRPFVIKFSTVRTNLFSTYVPVSYEDCVWYLGKVADADRNSMVILEEIVEGYECAISGFFNGTQFMKPFFINFEHKKLMDGEIGPNTGEMGTLGFYTYNDLPFVSYLRQLEDYLRSINYVGIVDIDCIVNDDGYYVLEFTSRFGFPTVMVMSPLHTDNLGDIIIKCLDGEDSFNVNLANVWSCGVCLNVAGYPYDEIVNKAGFIKIHGLTDEFEFTPLLGFAAVSYRDDGYYTCPGHGRALVANGVGSTISKAREIAYSWMNMIHFSDMMYRLDIGIKVKSWLNDLINLGIVPETMEG